MAEIIEFNRGVPPAESFPKGELVQSAKNVILNDGDQILQYGSAMGYVPLREWIAEEFNTNPENVIVGQGSLQLLDVFIKTQLKAGDTVFIEQPIYDRVLTLFRRAGMRIKGFLLNNGSVDLDEIESELKKGEVPGAFYTIPDFQNPSGAEMPPATRKGLVALARRFGFTLIEDGAYRHLRYRGEDLPRLYDLAPRHVLHMSSFSKMISPGIRVGFMVGEADLIYDLASYAENTYINASHINQAVISDFIRRGLMDEHVAFLNSIYAPKLERILTALDEFMTPHGTWVQPRGGFFTGVFLNPGKAQPEEKTLAKNGLKLMDGRGFFIEDGEGFIRLPFAAPSFEQIERGVETIAGLISNQQI